jgi:hypothetical protein
VHLTVKLKQMFKIGRRVSLFDKYILQVNNTVHPADWIPDYLNIHFG